MRNKHKLICLVFVALGGAASLIVTFLLITYLPSLIAFQILTLYKVWFFFSFEVSWICELVSSSFYSSFSILPLSYSPTPTPLKNCRCVKIVSHYSPCILSSLLPLCLGYTLGNLISSVFYVSIYLFNPFLLRCFR